MAVLTVDYNYQTIINIPEYKRTVERYEWMLLHSEPLITQNNNFDDDFNEDRFAALHNSQILSYEHYLNSVLNPINPIYIIDGVNIEETYLYIRNELFSTDTYLYTRAEAQPSHYLYTRAEFDLQGTDFIIFLSNTDSGLQTKLETEAEKFKPGGKTFSIELY